MLDKEKICLLIMAGGAGKRLMTLTKGIKPKCLLEDSRKNTILKRNIECFKKFIENNIFILTDNPSIKKIKEKVNNSKFWKFISEPYRKGSLIATIFALRIIMKKQNNPIIIYTCSDIVFENIKKLNESILEGFKEAKKGKIVMLGVKPKYIAEDFGYIKCERNKKLVKKVILFKEKPKKIEINQKFTNNSYWQAGVLIFKLSDFFSLIYQHTKIPLNKIYDLIYSVDLNLPFKYIYKNIKKKNINYDFLEKLPKEKLSMVLVDSKWYNINDVKSYNEFVMDSNLT